MRRLLLEIADRAWIEVKEDFRVPIAALAARGPPSAMLDLRSALSRVHADRTTIQFATAINRTREAERAEPGVWGAH